MPDCEFVPTLVLLRVPPPSQGSKRDVIESSDVGCEAVKSRKIAKLSELGDAKAAKILFNCQMFQRFTKVDVFVFATIL